MTEIAAINILILAIESSKDDINDPYIQLKMKHVINCVKLAKKFLYMFDEKVHSKLLNSIILHDVGRFINKNDHCVAGKLFLEKLRNKYNIPQLYIDIAFNHGQLENKDFSIFNLFTRDIDCLENLMRLTADGIGLEYDSKKASKHIIKQSKIGLIDIKMCENYNDYIYYYNAWIDHNFTFSEIKNEAKKYIIIC